MVKTWCVGGMHYSDTIKRVEFEKVNAKTEKLPKIICGLDLVISVVVRNLKFLLTK